MAVLTIPRTSALPRRTNFKLSNFFTKTLLNKSFSNKLLGNLSINEVKNLKFINNAKHPQTLVIMSIK